MVRFTPYTLYIYMRRLLPVLFALSALSAQGQTRSMFTPLGAADYPITAEGLPYFALSEPVGRASEGCTYKVSIEYPEYAALTPEERSLISESGIEVPDSMTVDVFRGVARGDVRLDISFCPIVNRDGRPMRLVSCRVRIDTLQPRQGIAEAQDFSVAARYRDHSVLASGRWVKIAVASEGIYSLTPAALAQMGFSNPARVRLFGYGGRMLPELLEFSGRNAVTDDLEEIPLYRRSDALLFFAEGTRRWTDGVHANNPYSTLSYYFLTEGDVPAAFETLPAPTETASQVLDEAYHYAVIANNDDMIARYTTVDARLAAALSYGANFRNLVVLEPADERIKEAYRYFGIKFSDAQGVTKVTPVDISLTGLTYHDKFIFDGDSAVMLDTAVADKIVLSGSNFSALDASSTKVVIDGVEITGATLKDNALTVTLPSSLNGKNLQHLVLTDGKISTTLDLTE